MLSSAGLYRILLLQAPSDTPDYFVGTPSSEMDNAKTKFCSKPQLLELVLVSFIQDLCAIALIVLLWRFRYLVTLSWLRCMLNGVKSCSGAEMPCLGLKNLADALILVRLYIYKQKQVHSTSIDLYTCMQFKVMVQLNFILSRLSRKL